MTRARGVWIRGGAIVAATAVAAVCAFVLLRPRVEESVRRRIERVGARRGWVTRVGSVRLRPWLSLELRDLVLQNQPRWRVEIAEAVVRPRLAWRLLLGRAVRVALSRTSVDLQSGFRLEFQPSSWAVDSLGNGWRLRHAGSNGRIDLSAASGASLFSLSVSVATASLTDLVRVLRNGCPIAKLGTLDGEGRLERNSHGLQHLVLRARTRGLAVASLSALADADCGDDPFGVPTDVAVEAEATIDPAAGSLTAHRLRAAAGGIEASGRLVVLGGASDPRVDLEADVPRLDLARVLATAGLDLPAQDLGSAALAVRVTGRLLDPASLSVTQRLDFDPPARPLPAIERLKTAFVHRAESAQGGAVDILVSPESPDFIPVSEVPPLFVRALLIAEDAGFYGHRGIDLAELPVALSTNISRGGFVRGASTIPQQLAKNLFLSRKKTLSRKVEEAALALLLDSALGKQRLLEIYLNVIEWGPGVYGLRPAARHYFDREPGALTPRQVTFLVCLIPGPIKYQRSFATGELTPFYEGLMSALLAKLQSVGAISEEEHQTALTAPLELQLPSVPESAPTPITIGAGE